MLNITCITQRKLLLISRENKRMQQDSIETINNRKTPKVTPEIELLDTDYQTVY